MTFGDEFSQSGGSARQESATHSGSRCPKARVLCRQVKSKENSSTYLHNSGEDCILPKEVRMFAQNRPASIILCALSTLVLTGVPYKIGLMALSRHYRFTRLPPRKAKGTAKGFQERWRLRQGRERRKQQRLGRQSGIAQSSGKGPGGTRERPDKKSGGTSSVTKAQQTKRLIDGNDRSGRSIAILHSNGMREEISGDRYEMRDAGGRTIVNRPATQSDLARLLRFQR